MLIYELPVITSTAPAPFTYTQSAQLGNQVTISNSQIVRSGANTIAEVLNNIAGVQYVAGLAAEPQIFIHSEPALIMVNGQALTNFSSAAPDINLIPLSEIKEIVITPGVAGTTYGDQTLGGVINIITQSPQKAEQSVSVMAGSPWMNQINAISSGPINATTSYRVDAQNQFENGYRYYNQQKTFQGGGVLQKEYATGSVTVDLHAMHQDLQFPGYLTDLQVEQNPKQSIAAQGEGSSQGNTGLLNNDWKQNLNTAWSTDTNLSYRGQALSSQMQASTFSQSYGTITLAPELKGQFQTRGNPGKTDIGLMFSDENYNLTTPEPSSFAISDANQQEYSAYGDIDFPVTSKLTANTSGRLVDVETNGQFYNWQSYPYQLNPESNQSQNLSLLTLGLKDQISDQTSVYVRRAMGYQLPFIDQSNFTAYPSTGFGLQATTSTAYETGLNWQGNQVQLNTEAFLINLNNEISYYIPPSGPAANYNLPPTRRQGMSFDGSYEPDSKWTLGASLTLMNNYFRGDLYTGNQIPGASDVLTDFTARYQINPIWSLYGESQYTGTEYANSDNYNAAPKIPAYWVENVAVNADFVNWLLSFRLNNLTNTTYYLYTTYVQGLSSFNTDAVNPITYYPAPGRNFMVSLTYKFD